MSLGKKADSKGSAFFVPFLCSYSIGSLQLDMMHKNKCSKPDFFNNQRDWIFLYDIYAKSMYYNAVKPIKHIEIIHIDQRELV